MRHARSSPPAFTLIELLLVLVVLSAALAIAAPSLSGWGGGQRLRDAGDDFLATARWASGQAIANSRTYRLQVDTHAGQYWVTVQDGLEFVPLDEPYARATVLPTNVTLTMSDQSSQPADFIEFDATGRTSPRIVRMGDDREELTIVCQAPAEGLRILKRGEQLQ